MAPFTLIVLDHPAESSWRSWLFDQAERRHGQLAQTMRDAAHDQAE
jgi:hypothetical protein